MKETTGNIKSLWYRPFTRNFREQDFKIIPKGVQVKCVVAHVEEAFIQNGEQMYYKQGRNFNKPIILIKPEIVSVHHVDTPDEDIDINYFKLYKAVKL